MFILRMVARAHLAEQPVKSISHANAPTAPCMGFLRLGQRSRALGAAEPKKAAPLPSLLSRNRAPLRSLDPDQRRQAHGLSVVAPHDQADSLDVRWNTHGVATLSGLVPVTRPGHDRRQEI